jgi:hypothetical protein
MARLVRRDAHRSQAVALVDLGACPSPFKLSVKAVLAFVFAR